MLDSPGNTDAPITVNGIKTEITVRGQGRPLLFVHSELGIAADAPVLDHLARDFKVIAPSLPGYGRTEMPRWYSTVDDLAYFTLDLADQLDLRDAVLVGSSFGGWVAAEVATKSVERFSHVVLADPAGIKTGDREHRDMIDIFGTPQKELEALCYHDPGIAKFDLGTASEEQIYIRLRNRESTVLFGWSPYMYNPKLANRLHRIRRPTLVLWGSADRLASPDYGRSFASRIPGATFEMFEQAGRFGYLEQPAAFASRVAAHAKSA